MSEWNERHRPILGINAHVILSRLACLLLGEGRGVEAKGDEGMLEGMKRVLGCRPSMPGAKFAGSCAWLSLTGGWRGRRHAVGVG